MKKVLALALGMLLVPFTAFGMQTMSESDMDSVTGQSGVAISVNDIIIYNEGGDEIWYVTQFGVDPTDDNRAGGAVGMVGDAAASLTYYNAMFWSKNNVELAGNTETFLSTAGSGGDIDLFGTQYGTVNGNMFVQKDESLQLYEVLAPRPLMISAQSGLLADAVNLGLWYTDTLTDGAEGVGASGVLIELGTIEINQTGAEVMKLYVADIEEDVDYSGIQTAGENRLRQRPIQEEAKEDTGVFSAGTTDNPYRVTVAMYEDAGLPVEMEVVNTYSMGELHTVDGVMTTLLGDIVITSRDYIVQSDDYDTDERY